MVTNLIRQSESKKPFNWGSFGTDVAIGGLFGLAGAAGPAAAAVGKFLKPAAAAIGKFLPAAGKYIASAARSSSTGAQTVAKSAKAATTGSSGIRMGGQSTYGGVDKATQNMLKFSERNPQAGYYDVIGHGSPTSLAGMSVDELAIKIGSRSGGQHVRLLSCQTGCPTGTFAQDLADRLGVRVMAPTTDIGSSGSGKTLTIFDGGEWRWFDPN